MCARDILLGGNPTMDLHPIQGGAMETGISSGHLDLCLPKTCRISSADLKQKTILQDSIIHSGHQKVLILAFKLINRFSKGPAK